MIKVASKDLKVGDIIYLLKGDQVPVDCLILNTGNN